MSEYNVNHQPNGAQPGKGAAIASLVCGIVSIVFVLFSLPSLGTTSLLSVVLGIVGVVLASMAKKAGFVGGIQSAGFVLSIIGLALGAVIFLSCVACASAFTSLA